MAKRPREEETVAETSPESVEVTVVPGTERLPEGNTVEPNVEVESTPEPTPSGQVNGF